MRWDCFVIPCVKLRAGHHLGLRGKVGDKCIGLAGLPPANASVQTSPVVCQ